MVWNMYVLHFLWIWTKKIHTSIIQKKFNTYLICLFLIIKNVYFLEKTRVLLRNMYIRVIYGMCTLLTMLKRIKFTNINISVQIQSTRILNLFAIVLLLIYDYYYFFVQENVSLIVCNPFIKLNVLSQLKNIKKK